MRHKIIPFVAVYLYSVSIAQAVTLNNPFPSVSGLPQFIEILITIMQWVLSPIFVVLMVYAGYMLVTANGDTKKLELAKAAILWSIVGGFIMFGAKVIASAIQGTLTPFLTI